jgi:hypothetical protein
VLLVHRTEMSSESRNTYRRTRTEEMPAEAAIRKEIGAL